MRLLLVLVIAALAACHAAPQFDNSESWGWGSTDLTLQAESQSDHGNRNTYVVPQQQIHPQHQQQNDHPLQDNRGSSNQCWDPVNQAYRDWPNQLKPTPEYPSQFYNNQHYGLNNRHPPRDLNPHFANQFPNDWDQPGPSYGPPTRGGRNSQHGHEHGQGSPPPHHHHGYGGPPPPHHHGYGGPPPPHHHGHGGPPPPHHHGHGGPPPPHHHGHGGPPPPHHHGHGGPPPPHHHGHGGPPPPHHHGYDHRPPPPHYGYGHGIPPPPRRPAHNPQNVNDQELEICQDSKEDTTPNPVEIFTPGKPGAVTTPSSSELQSTSMNPVRGDDGPGTVATTVGPVKTTTEFDWNNYALEASVDNPGGAGVIDFRGDFTSDTSS